MSCGNMKREAIPGSPMPEGEAVTRCKRCRMAFRADPPVADGDAGGIEFLRCPDCGRRFWAAPRAGANGRCAVGLLPTATPAITHRIAGALR